MVNLCVHGIIILKLALEKVCGDCCEYGNEHLGSIRSGTCLDDVGKLICIETD